MTPPVPAKLAYSVKEAVAILPWGKTKVYEMIASGELATRKKYGRRYILHEDLVALILSVPADAPKPQKSDE
jgi:excisionase family DNA binding protein